MTAGTGMVIAGFDGTSAPDCLLRRIAAGRVGGVIFFGRNVEYINDFSSLVKTLQKARPAGAPPLILSIDQEGGRVQRIRAPLSVWPPMAHVGALGDLALTERVGFALGTELRVLGLNLDYAPVLDVHTHPANPVIGDRAFSADARQVALHARQFWRGLERAGIRGCGKHFPGHGDSDKDSHLELPVVDKSKTRLWTEELVPFAALIQAGLPMVMTAHVVYSQIDSLPATCSSRWITQVLRGELGFRGVIVSDDLEMKAVSERQPVERTVAQAFLAGVDAFLVCRDQQMQAEVEKILLAQAQQSLAVRTRLEEAKARLMSFRYRLSQDVVPAQPSSQMLAEHAELIEAIAQRTRALDS